MCKSKFNYLVNYICSRYGFNVDNVLCYLKPSSYYTDICELERDILLGGENEYDISILTPNNQF